MIAYDFERLPRAVGTKDTVPLPGVLDARLVFVVEVIGQFELHLWLKPYGVSLIRTFRPWLLMSAGGCRNANLAT